MGFLSTVSHSAGLDHPGKITPDHIDILHPGFRSQGLDELLVKP